MNERERSLRQSLGIRDDVQQVLIVEQSAHCDWDWVCTFDQYYQQKGNPSNHQPVRTTLQQALALIGSSYTYVFCEVGYLRRFMEDPQVSAADKTALRSAAGSTFLFSSGGITSAENLTLHTEAFIRNYLLGRQWLSQTFGVSASNQMWIPDDFGHDAQLPVLLKAMGFTGAGFERIPAQTFAPSVPCSSNPAKDDAPSVFLDTQVGYDFIWEASDGSTIQAHWLSGGYCAGNGALGSAPASGGIDVGSPNGFSKLIAQNSSQASPNVPYMFSPIDCDFTAPYVDLATVIANWNQSNAVQVVQASFDDYMQLVASSMSLRTVDTRGNDYPAFIPHPYYSGCYGSKPLLKSQHYKAARTLLLAETMQLILHANGNDGHLSALDAAWHLLVPSTHHDYITGTATNGNVCVNKNGENVYGEEQVPLVQAANDAADAVRDAVLEEIAGLQLAPTQSGSLAVLVFNGVGYDRGGVAWLRKRPSGSFASSTDDFATFRPIQSDGQGGLYLLVDDIPAMGYATVFLTATPPNVQTGLSASQPPGQAVTMSNGLITVEIAATGITSITNAQDPGSPNYLAPNASAGLAFYNDGGNLYRFGNEIVCLGPTNFYEHSDMGLDATIDLVTAENAPLCATAVQNTQIGGQAYTITYQLFVTDTAIRVTVQGTAPSGYSVMANVPFAGTPVALTYGTTSHWDTQSPRQAFTWPSVPSNTQLMTFEPTHEYVAPTDANGNILGAIYHYASPGWAINQQTNAILGCLLRNTPGTQNAACGTDGDPHTVSYAIAPPIGLEMPNQGAAIQGSMLREALALHNPLEAVAVPANTDAKLPRFMRIAKATDDRALVTVAKTGTLDPSRMIVRVYQPTNQPMSAAEVRIDGLIAQALKSGGTLQGTAVTAIEEPSQENLHITTGSASVTLDLPHAITTVALSGS